MKFLDIIGSSSRENCVLLCETKAKTSCAVTADMLSHDAAHVIYATKTLDSLVCTFVLILVSHETAMVMLIQFCGTFPTFR